MKTKVLYVSSSLSRTGPTNQLLGLVSALDKELFQPQILTLSPHPANSRHKDFEQLGIKVDTLNLSRKEYIIHGNKELSAFINTVKPDIIHTSGVRSDGAVAQLKITKNHCMTLHNFAMEDYLAKYGYVLGKLLNHSTTKAIRHCEFVICCSKTLTEKYANHYKRSFTTIQNGIDTAYFSCPEDISQKLALREKNQLPVDKKIFLMVGSMIKRKNPLTVLKAFEEANLESAHLVVLGEGPLLEEAKNQTTNPRVHFRGNVDNVEEFILAADCYLSASLSEGLPMSVLEAGSMGLNMILSDIPQHREVFADSDIEPRYFDKLDSKQLSLIFESVQDTDILTINHQISKHIQTYFSNNGMARKYEAVYKEMTRKSA